MRKRSQGTQPGPAHYASVFLCWLRPQGLEHAPSDEGAAQVQSVIAQQQFIVAHERVREPAEADPRAQKARASLEVRDRDEPPARGRSQEEGAETGRKLLVVLAPPVIVETFLPEPCSLYRLRSSSCH